MSVSVKSLSTPRLARRVAATRRGFSAVELIAVATIMAILSMILVQSLRTRVAESRVTAAKHELAKIAGIMETSYAETNRYFPLQNYDNTKILNSPQQDPTIEVPHVYYDQTGTVRILASNSTEHKAIARVWNGRYTSFKNTATINEIKTLFPNIISATGPLYYVTVPTDEGQDLYPLDPWGNPYIFESTYAGPALYSMGPDGLPGPITGVTLPPTFPLNANYQYYDPKYPLGPGMLGYPGSDDIKVEF